MSIENNLVKVVLASEIPPGSMKHVDIGGKEIAPIEVDGQFYAIEERCEHMNAPMAMGQIRLMVKIK